MVFLKLYKLELSPKQSTTFQKNLLGLSKKEVLLVWSDLLKMSEEREKQKNLEEDKLNKFSGKEKMFCIKSL